MDRKELEELWRSRVLAAKLRFDAARDRTNAIVREFPLAGTSPNSRYAYQRAVRLENAALAEYQHVLRIYTDLVVRHMVPDEDDWHRRKGMTSGGGAT